MTFDAWWASDVGLVRKSNEDSVGFFPDLDLFVVADGMGGRAAGEVASRLAVDVIHDFFQRLGDSGSSNFTVFRVFTRVKDLVTSAPASDARPPDADLQEAIRLANRRIYEAGATANPEDTISDSMGSTVVALKLDRMHGRAAWAHVGDSRLYRARGAELMLLTADHTLYGEVFQRQPNVPTDLPHTNRLLQALGVFADVDVTTAAAAVLPGDLFLLCSDGISGFIDPSTLRDHLAAAEPLATVGEHLVRLAKEGGGKDNLSLVLVRAAAA